MLRATPSHAPSPLGCRTKPLHEHLGLGPTMRASCYIYNTPSDLQLLVLRIRDAIPRTKPLQEKVMTSWVRGQGCNSMHSTVSVEGMPWVRASVA